MTDRKLCPFAIEDNDYCDANCNLYDAKGDECGISKLIREVEQIKNTAPTNEQMTELIRIVKLVEEHQKNILKLIGDIADKRTRKIEQEPIQETKEVAVRE